jgi:hypothetical protein
MDGDAFARDQLGQRVDLALDALGPFAIESIRRRRHAGG